MERRTFITAAFFSAFVPSISIADKTVTAQQYKIDFTGNNDSTDELQRLLDDAAKEAVKTVNGIGKVEVNLCGAIKITQSLRINASRINIRGPVTFYFELKKKSDFGIILESDGEPGASYTNGVGSLFDSINFCTKTKIKLIFASNKNNSNNNPSCLINISQCRFSGFKNIFTNGPGGWGWSWDRCGFDRCDNLLYLTQQMDTYERFTFTACIWQNGGVAFFVDNPFGKIYWNTGSFDYCDAIAVLNKGYVSVSGHLEIKNPKDPMVRMNSTECGFYFTNGNIYIFDKNEEYILFQQFEDGQVTLRDIDFLYDNVDSNLLKISNEQFASSSLKHNVRKR